MNCVKCNNKSCRVNLESCGAEKFDIDKALQQYKDPYTQKIVQAAAKLVDNGKAGTLSRIEEIIEFSKNMGYRKIGIAYCYGMEKLALDISDLLKLSGLNIVSTSCTVGSFMQNEVNDKSDINNVSCNPVSQAEQLNSEGVDFVIIIGLCLGHDIIFHKHIKADFTTLVVKDRTTGHNPIESINKLIQKLS